MSANPDPMDRITPNLAPSGVASNLVFSRPYHPPKSISSFHPALSAFHSTLEPKSLLQPPKTLPPPSTRVHVVFAVVRAVKGFFCSESSCTKTVFVMFSWMQSTFSGQPPAVRFGLTAAVIGISAVAAAFVRPRLPGRKHSYTAEAVCTFRYDLALLTRALSLT